MRDRYIYRWGFVWRVKQPEVPEFIKVCNKAFADQQRVLQNLMFRPGQIIDCNMISDLKEITSYGGPF